MHFLYFSKKMNLINKYLNTQLHTMLGQICIPGLRELQADDVEHSVSVRAVVVFNKVTKPHLHITLATHINHINLFVCT